MGNERILLIETSTLTCSLALSNGLVILAQKIVREPKAHAKIVSILLRELLEETGEKLDSCDAVCVSSGPGSYTGLRVGVSFAKGLCYGAGIPLISVGSMELLAHCVIERAILPEGCRFIAPMIDARRMEVYTALFTDRGEEINHVEAHIITNNSFLSALEDGVVLFCGDGAQKAGTLIDHPNARFLTIDPTADGMLHIALEKLKKRQFEDLAYFEPFYLKDFIAGPLKKLL